jgi:hypothetical protein
VAEEPERKQARAELIGLIAVISLPAGLVALWLSPRPAPPDEMPALILPAAEVAHEIAAQHALAAHAPESEEETHRRELYLATGRAEVHMDDSPEQYASRAAALSYLASQIATQGDDALAAARARDVDRMMPALRGEGDEDERTGELGAFPRNLERYGEVVDGRRIAPEFVLRTGFFARWNAIHGLDPTDGMTPLARRAYYGWLALEGGDAPVGMRREAVDAYAAAGGTRVWESRGVLAYAEGEMAEARVDFEHAYDLTGSVRLRNNALAAARAEAELGAD